MYFQWYRYCFSKYFTFQAGSTHDINKKSE